MSAIVLMNERVTREERLQSLGEEIANSVSAGAGLIAAIAGIPLLLAFATQRGSNWTVAGALIFASRCCQDFPYTHFSQCAIR